MPKASCAGGNLPVSSSTGLNNISRQSCTPMRIPRARIVASRCHFQSIGGHRGLRLLSLNSSPACGGLARDTGFESPAFALPAAAAHARSSAAANRVPLPIRVRLNFHDRNPSTSAASERHATAERVMRVGDVLSERLRGGGVVRAAFCSRYPEYEHPRGRQRRS